MEVFIISVLCCAIMALWLRIRELEYQIDNDNKYLEWYLRSLEERKADKDEADVVDDWYED